MKKIYGHLIVTTSLIIIFLLLSSITSHDIWTKQTRADFSILSILNKLSIFIFLLFVLLYMIKKFIKNKIVLDFFKYFEGDYISFIINLCITLTILIPLFIIKVRFFWFIFNYIIVSFIFLFGIAIICNQIFFKK